MNAVWYLLLTYHIGGVMDAKSTSDNLFRFEIRQASQAVCQKTLEGLKEDAATAVNAGRLTVVCEPRRGGSQADVGTTGKFLGNFTGLDVEVHSGQDKKTDITQPIAPAWECDSSGICKESGHKP